MSIGSISTVPIGLQGFLQTLHLSPQPQELYQGKMVPGRTMLVVVQYGVNLLGGIDFMYDGSTITLISFYNFISVTKGSTPFSMGLKDGSDIIYLDCNNGSLLVSTETGVLPYVSFKSFIITSTHPGPNIYCMDHIHSTTDGVPILIREPIETVCNGDSSASFINTQDVCVWSNTQSEAKRVGKVVNITGKATLTTGVNEIRNNIPVDLITVTPTDKFFNALPTIGSALIKNGNNAILNGTVINDVTNNSVVKLQILIPENLIEGDTREISFNLSYIVS